MDRWLCCAFLLASVTCAQERELPPTGLFDQLAAGGAHTCGVRRDQSVYCWGRRREGQAKPPADAFVRVAAGQVHTCGVVWDGSIRCWGADTWGQRGSRSGPVPCQATRRT